MEIIIYTMKKEPNIIITNDEDTILEIMTKLKEITGINIQKTRLLYKDIYLNPNNTVESYNIKHGDIMYLILR